MALASLMCGILGLLFWLPSIPAIILGHVASSKIRHSNGEIGGQGKAIAGLIMGYIGLVLIFIIAVLAAIASPIIIRQISRARATIAINNSKDVYMGLRDYAFENAGALPGQPGDGKSANEQLRVLFEAGYFDSERQFFLQGVDGYVMGDERMSGDKALSVGENIFAYVPGANITNGPADRPILLAPLKVVSGRIMIDQSAFGGQLIVLNADGSAMVYQVMDDGSSAIDDRGETVFEDGEVIFENAEGSP